MSYFFPVLNGKSLQDLSQLFSAEPCHEVLQENEGALFFEEAAIAISKHGNDGIRFLLNYLSIADSSRLQAVLVGLGCADKKVCMALLNDIKTVLPKYLTHSDAAVVAEAIESANRLGFADMANRIRPLLNHESPFVMGSALRFLAHHQPMVAKPLLYDALSSSHPIVRENAIDELDELDCKEALPRIRTLLDDPDKNVRQAAKTAIENLDMAG